MYYVGLFRRQCGRVKRNMIYNEAHAPLKAKALSMYFIFE